MKTTWKNYEIESEYVGEKNNTWDENSSDRHHVVTLKNTENGKEVEFDYWTSRMHPEIDSRDELLEAASAFFSDASFGFDSFREFALENGYDIPEELYDCWKACKRAKKDAKMLVGKGTDWEDVANELREEIEG